MKRGMKSIIAVLLVFAMVTALIPRADAASTSVKQLRAGKTYSIDLDGGSAKEAVKFKFNMNTTSDVSFGRFYLYVNGAKVYTSSRLYGDSCYVYSLDVNTSDKYTELLVYTTGDSECLESMFVCRYKDAQHISVYKLDASGFNGDYFRTSGDWASLGTIASNTGKNLFYINVDTPFYNGSFGTYYAQVGMKLENGKLVPCNSSTYRLESDFMQQCLYTVTGSKYYKLAKNMRMTESLSGSSSYTILKTGTKFTATYIHPSTKSGDLYVKVKTTDGKTGWICFPNNYSQEVIKYHPVWG